jgi:hypothetical protein
LRASCFDNVYSFPKGNCTRSDLNRNEGLKCDEYSPRFKFQGRDIEEGGDP